MYYISCQYIQSICKSFNRTPNFFNKNHNVNKTEVKIDSNQIPVPDFMAIPPKGTGSNLRLDLNIYVGWFTTATDEENDYDTSHLKLSSYACYKYPPGTGVFMFAIGLLVVPIGGGAE